MPSSTAMAGRTAIVLGCLFLLPLIAVIGPTLPKPLRSPENSANGSAELPPKSAASHAKSSNSSRNEPKRKARDRAEKPTENEPRSTAPPVPGSAGESPVEPPARSSAHESASRSDDDRASLDDLLSELHSLNVEHFKLESWGNDGELFRCDCQAPAAVDGGRVRHFEATAAEPATALAQVVADVRRWRSSQASRASVARRAAKTASHDAAARGGEANRSPKRRERR